MSANTEDFIGVPIKCTKSGGNGHQGNLLNRHLKALFSLLNPSQILKQILKVVHTNSISQFNPWGSLSFAQTFHITLFGRLIAKDWAVFTFTLLAFVQYLLCRLFE